MPSSTETPGATKAVGGTSGGTSGGDNGHYLGLDLSTQQLKAIIVDEQLKAVAYAAVAFDADFPEYKTEKGVYKDGLAVQAPVVMWLDAIDLVLERLRANGADLSKVRGVSGACQQHGSVFLNAQAKDALAGLDAAKGSLKDQLEASLAWDRGPNWQDHSTEQERRDFEAAVGGPDELARITGSCGHHRFTGLQILKLRRTQPQVYANTDRIALVSSFAASVFAGRLAAVDIGDACGMNLWDITKHEMNPKLLDLVSGGDAAELERKLGPVDPAGGSDPVGPVASYFVAKYGFAPDCQILPFTGDNPGTILALPLEVNDVIVSLGTSTTALVVTENYVPSPMYHLFSHPVGKGYMGMLCYCNGALAREQVRDAVNAAATTTASAQTDPWSAFSKTALERQPIGTKPDTQCVGFYFPLSEIIPDRPATLTRVVFDGDNAPVAYTEPERPPPSVWSCPDDDALRILESQALSIRYRLEPMLTTTHKCPRRVYFVGGSSRNDAICEAMARVLVPADGAFRLDLSDACAKGAAHKAAYGAAVAAGSRQAWEEFIVARWSDRKETIPFDSTDRYAGLVRRFPDAEALLPTS